jgi:hypothetical protein
MIKRELKIRNTVKTVFVQDKSIFLCSVQFDPCVKTSYAESFVQFCEIEIF